MPPAEPITAADLADGAADLPLLDDRARVTDPVLVVDLETPAGPVTVRAASAAAQRSDRLLVGTARAPGHPLAPALDVVLVPARTHRADDRTSVAVTDAPAAAETLRRRADVAPVASLVLGGLLRRTSGTPVADALDAESLAYSTLLGGAEFGRWLVERRATGSRPAPADVPEPVRLVRDGDRLTITLNRPERRNAFGRQIRDAVVEALRLAVLDPSVTSVVLRGAGPAFCSGGDLDEFGTAADLATAHLVRTRGGPAGLLHSLADRTVVHLHGACVGAGIELPAFAGRVLAAPDSTFRLPEIGMGLIPGAGGTVAIPRRIGRWRTFYMALDGAAVPLEQALAWGLVDAASPRPS
ncbi:enoyl-CoA hydratase/isomerase family protein [Pseudonocardia sp. KRD291]|uniref:enoyl-CoA hydratase/isomerase family protein n=1 Tax=Pseudonocardia sp. KRD291 TaxID=2792007 RepID=UPI001C4A6C18|nr:enoyl-CoA hydratase/isomerase family protein [Pseudonocardia sp. KRD291]MBW0101229.1 enoyl-CoA hydratase/isomerase family protein [Pseudonocardia sp. KRD291]